MTVRHMRQMARNKPRDPNRFSLTYCPTCRVDNVMSLPYLVQGVVVRKCTKCGFEKNTSPKEAR